MEEEEEKANHLEIARVRFPGLGFLSFYLCFVFFFGLASVSHCFCFSAKFPTTNGAWFGRLKISCATILVTYTKRLRRSYHLRPGI